MVINSIITNSTGKRTDTKLYIPVETLSIQDNAKLLEQLKSGFKITINWNKYVAKSKRTNDRKTKLMFGPTGM